MAQLGSRLVRRHWLWLAAIRSFVGVTNREG
jgi:hypothetical protein